MTWTDPETNLMWEVKTTESIEKNYAFDQAQEYAKELNSQNYAEYNDWRVPSVKELESLLRHSYGRYYGIYDDKWDKWFEHHKHLRVENSFIKFPLTYNETKFWAWTNEKNQEIASDAFSVGFDCGYVNSCNVDLQRHVRCVRGI